MQTSIPKSVRDAWGEEATEAFARWFEQAVHKVAVPRDEYREVLSRLDLIEHDLSSIKERLDRVDSRLDRVDDRFDQMHAQFNDRFDQTHAQFNDRFDQMYVQFNDRFDQMYVQFNDRFDRMNDRFDQLHEQTRAMTRWTVGTIALFGTLITVLLAIAQFTS